MIMNSSVFITSTTCNPKLTNISEEHTQEFYLLPASFWSFYLADSLLLKMEGISSFETSADIYKTMLHYIPDNRIPKIQSFTSAAFFFKKKGNLYTQPELCD
jgi:hypothetical protein